MFESFDMDIDQPMHASPSTTTNSSHSESLPSIQSSARQRILRHPTSMPVLTCQSTDDYYTVAHERLHYASSTNEEDHPRESDTGRHRKRFRKTKNSCFNQSEDGHESDTDDHPQFRVRERDSTFAMPVEGAFTPRCDSLTHVDVGPPDSAISPMFEDEAPRRLKRVRVASGADPTMVTSVSEGKTATERRPMKKLRASI